MIQNLTWGCGELFGVLVQLAEGEAKATLKEMVDKGYAQDGYKALLILGKRFDNQTTASLLQLFLDVINPGSLKVKEITRGIHKCQAKVAVLLTRFGEAIGGNIKLAILIGMLPKEYQDICIQASYVMEK